MGSLQDAWRDLTADRRFTATAVLLLSLTIGAATAVYAVVYAVILRPLPFAEPGRVAVIWQRDLRRAQPVSEVAYGEAQDWARRSRSFDEIGVMGSVNWTLTLDGPTPESFSMAAVSAPFFRVVQRRAHLGRTLDDSDEVGAVPRTALISHGLWVRRFGRDPHIVGRRLSANITEKRRVTPIEIVGVMPEGFDFPRGTDVWAPAAPLVRASAADWTGGDERIALRWLRVFYAVGKLRHGVSPSMAAAELSPVIRATDTEGGPEPPAEAVVIAVRAYLLGPAEPVLWTLLGGTALMLLIACANVAGLQIARATARARALAIRLTLGARPVQLAWHSAIESLLVTTAALAGSIAFAWAAVRLLLWLSPADVLRMETVTLLDPRMLAFGTVAALLTTLGSGIWPALVVVRTDAMRVLAHGQMNTSRPRGRLVQRLVVTAQVALALTLLVGTALFVRTVRGLDRTILGFEPQRLLALEITPDTGDIDRWNAVYDAIQLRVAAVPGVTTVSGISLRPLSGPIGFDSQPVFPGQPGNDPSTWGLNPHLNCQTVTPALFSTMAIRVVRGRGFLPTDTINAPGVVIVSESAARRMWPGKDPIGQQLFQMGYRPAPGASPKAFQTVVGVVADVRYRGLNDIRLDMYVPAAQSQQRLGFLMVRTASDDQDVVAAIRAAALEIDSRATFGRVAWMSDVVATESAPWRFLVRVFLAFAVVAAALSAIGLGTVIALAVSARRRELAIRAALGATGAHLRALVMREGSVMIAAGVAIGLVASLALGRLIALALVGVPPDDPIALLAAAAAAGIVGLVACWWPSRRAGHVDPIDALRAE